jgi:hypothetical protein
MQLLFWPRFTSVNSGHMWMLIKGYINQLRGKTPTSLRMGVSVPTTNFVGLSVTLTKTHRKGAIYAPYQSGQDACTLEDSLEMQPQRFVML